MNGMIFAGAALVVVAVVGWWLVWAVPVAAGVGMMIDNVCADDDGE